MEKRLIDEYGFTFLAFHFSLRCRMANYSCTRQFLCEVDSRSVMVNAFIHFADGLEYVLGAETEISTGMSVNKK